MSELGVTLAALLAGFLTFFAPCTLPLVPAFLGIVAGAKESSRKVIFYRAVGFILGFSLIFILFGLAFSVVGRVGANRSSLQVVGGIFIIMFGFYTLGWLPWLNFGSGSLVGSRLGRILSTWGTFGLGMLFALGWSPCVGPLLGSILLLASTSATVLKGTWLLTTFSIGLATPFLIVALFWGKAVVVFNQWKQAAKIFNILIGLFLIVLGGLLVSGHLGLLFSKIRFLLEGRYESYINKFL